MARNDDDEAPLTRQLLVGVAALLVVALLVAGVVSVVALEAARVTGIDGAGPTASARPTLYFPSGDPTTKLDPYPGPAGGPSSSASPQDGRSTKHPAKPKKKKVFSLQVTPEQVAPNERITLTGHYPGHDGAQLQVQRFETGWVDFPVHATVSAGAYSTYILTGRSGVQRLRMADPTGDRASNPVRVTVR
jgi:hypothetical protein